MYKGQLLSCKHCKESAHTGISCVQNKKLLVQKSYANVAKQSSNRQPPKKSTGARPPYTKPVGQGSTVPQLTSSAAFPELPKPPSQTEQSASCTRGNGPSDQIATTSSRVQPQSSHASSTPHQSSLPEVSKSDSALADLFKKPAYALRSSSKGGNETDESSASTNSSRSRHRPPGKKPRRETADDEQEGDRLL